MAAALVSGTQAVVFDLFGTLVSTIAALVSSQPSQSARGNS